MTDNGSFLHRAPLNHKFHQVAQACSGYTLQVAADQPIQLCPWTREKSPLAFVFRDLRIQRALIFRRVDMTKSSRNASPKLSPRTLRHSVAPNPTCKPLDGSLMPTMLAPNKAASLRTPEWRKSLVTVAEFLLMKSADSPSTRFSRRLSAREKSFC